MRCCFLILLFFGLLSCEKSEQVVAVDNIDIINTKDSSSISWLALGDSYTIGERVDPSDRYPSQAVDMLKVKRIKTEKLTYIATSGWTSADLVKAINVFNPSHYSIVTILIGVNDQFRGVDTSTYKENFITILNRAIDVTQGNSNNVIVLSIPDYSVTPIGKTMDTNKIRREIDLFNNINYRISKEYHCSYLYITDLTREALTNSELTSRDGLHPSALEYNKWAQLLYSQIGKTF